MLTYLPTYLTSYTSMEASQAQLATDIALIAYLLIIFGSGTLSDKVGASAYAAHRMRRLHRAFHSLLPHAGDGVAAHRYCRRADHA